MPNPPASAIPKVYLALGEEDELFGWLDRACERRSSQIMFPNVDAQPDSIRDSEQYRAFIEKPGL